MSTPNLPPVPPLTSAGFSASTWQQWLNYLRARVVASVLNIQIETANGFAGSVTTSSSNVAQITISTTVSGLVKGVSGQLTEAVPGTDYVVSVAGTTPVNVAGVSGVLTVSMPQASGTANGYLASSDWATFNAKVTAVTVSTPLLLSGTTQNPNIALSTSGVTAGTYGSATISPQITVDTYGRVTALTNLTITLPFSEITGTPTTATGYGITSIDGVPIGQTTPAAISSTTLTSSKNSKIAATNAGGQSIPNNTQTTVTGWTKQFDVQSEFVASTGIFTAKIAEYVYIEASLLFNTASYPAATILEVSILHNGAIVSQDVVQFPTSAASNDLVTLKTSLLVLCALGDTLQVQAFQNTGSALTLASSSTNNLLNIFAVP